MQRIGILGGTFDPPHYGHLAIAEEACWALHLSEMILIPAAKQPLKLQPHQATPQQRMEMVRLACEDNPLLLPSDIEIQRVPPSFTVDTLRDLRATLGNDVELWFVMGSDALPTLPRWHAPQELLQLAYLAVVARPDTEVDVASLESHLPGIGARTHVIEGPHLDISSTALRRRIAAGQPVRYQMPDRVIDYIHAQRLYQEP